MKIVAWFASLAFRSYPIHSAIITAPPPVPYGLAVHGGSPRRGLPTGLAADLGNQGVVNPVPRALSTPTAIPGMDRTPRREVMGQQSPLAAGADQVADRIEDLVEVASARSREMFFNMECGGSTPLSFFSSFRQPVETDKEKKKESGVEPPHSKERKTPPLLLH